ncbi:MAG: Glu/Leu/Phe/Val dehydrogenase [Chloroflexi bacterium]|nr:Glu/Leu/Phe/Val dehydrogenase [Chloroflexota bacterium]
MKIFDYMAQYDYEQVVLCTDKAVGLRAIIAIHDTTLGPSLGGCRMWPYASEEEAILDALRLARGMTYKNAAAGLDMGGGKATIIADPARDKSEALMRAFGRFVESLGGRYITTEDVGVTTKDMEFISTETSHVVGLPLALGGSGDPSSATAVGLLEAMKVCAREAWGSESLKGKTVAVQGLGKVATYLLPYLQKGGAKVVGCDVRREVAQGHKKEYAIEIVPPEKIYDVPCDIFSPCALGAVLNDKTIPRLKCRMVVGCANNQLAEDRHGQALMDRGILYAPDFIVNAGGVINLSFEFTGYDPEAALDRVKGIYHTMEQVLARAKSQGITTAQAADLLAEERIQSVRHIKKLYFE